MIQNTNRFLALRLVLFTVVASWLQQQTAVDAAAAYCGEDMCDIPLGQSCAAVLKEYDISGDCCSLVERPTESSETPTSSNSTLEAQGECHLLSTTSCYIVRKGATGCTTHPDGSQSCVVPGIQYGSASREECPESEFSLDGEEEIPDESEIPEEDKMPLCQEDITPGTTCNPKDADIADGCFVFEEACCGNLYPSLVCECMETAPGSDDYVYTCHYTEVCSMWYPDECETASDEQMDQLAAIDAQAWGCEAPNITYECSEYSSCFPEIECCCGQCMFHCMCGPDGEYSCYPMTMCDCLEDPSSKPPTLPEPETRPPSRPMTLPPILPIPDKPPQQNETCPESMAKPGDDCFEVGLTCTFGGEECCCGVCHPSLVCTCTDDLAYQCYHTDACLRPSCDMEEDDMDYVSEDTKEDKKTNKKAFKDDGDDRVMGRTIALDPAALDDADSSPLKPDSSESIYGGPNIGEACLEDAEPGHECYVPNKKCTYGEETCCGETRPSIECECKAGYGGLLYYICYETNACFEATCEEEASGSELSETFSSPTKGSEAESSETETSESDTGNYGYATERLEEKKEEYVTLNIHTVLDFTFFEGKGVEPNSAEIATLLAATKQFFRQVYKDSDFGGSFVGMEMSEVVPTIPDDPDHFELEFKTTVTVQNLGEGTMTPAQASEIMASANLKRYIGMYARAAPGSVFASVFKVHFKGVTSK